MSGALIEMFGGVAENKAARAEDDLIPTWSDTYLASVGLQTEYNNSISESLKWGEKHQQRMDAIAKRTGGVPGFLKFYPVGRNTMEQAESLREYIRRGDVQLDENFNIAPVTTRGKHLADIPTKLQSIRAVAFVDAMVAEAMEHGDDTVLSDQQILKALQAEAAEDIPAMQSMIQRGSGGAAFTGTMAGVLHDPAILATLPLGASVGAGRSALSAAARVGGTEGAIGLASELPIQMQAFQFRKELGQPMSFNEAAFNVLAATVGGAAIGGTIGGAIGLLRKYREGVADGRITPTPETENAASQLEAANQARETVPERTDVENHQERINQAHAEAEYGDLLDIPADRAIDEGITETPGVRAMDQSLRTQSVDGIAISNGAEIRVLDPEAIQVDAKRFQFKSDEGADEFGVRDTLREVQEFDPNMAGDVLAWESRSGEVFIVDGHQRLGIARRAKAAGQKDVLVTARVMREADGVTAEFAVELGSLRNATSTAGSALDVARVLRNSTNVDRIPGLGARTAAVQQGTALANLGDEAFDLAVNEVIPANYAAVVASRIDGDAEQVAAIDLLRKLEPANETQARAMVEEMRRVGFERQTTGDLFGEREIAESLIKERAQVLDAAMKQARSDKATFRRLVDQQEEIESTGKNRVDAEASRQRVSDSVAALARLTALANVRGPVADALNAAARDVKSGKAPKTVAENVLRAASGSDIDPMGVARPIEHLNGQRTSEAYPEFTPQQGLSPMDRAIENELMDILEQTPFEDLKADYLRYATDPETGDYRGLDPDDARKIISADVARELSPSFRENQGLAAAVHEPSSAFSKRLLAERLAEPIEEGADLFVHVAGGTGAGKTTGLQQNGRVLKGAHAILDSNLAKSPSAIRKIKAAQAAGLRTRIVYVYADPVGAGVRAVKRSLRKAKSAGVDVGRTVPLDQHAITHAGSRQAVEEAAAATDSELIVLMNTGAKGDPITVGNMRDVPEVSKPNVVKSLVEHVLEELRNGRINIGTARGFLDFTEGRRALGDSGLDREVVESIDPGSSAPGRSTGQESRQADRREPVQGVVERESAGRGARGTDDARTGRTDEPDFTETPREHVESTFPRLEEAIKRTERDDLDGLEQTVLQALRALEDQDVSIRVSDENGVEREVSAREFFDHQTARERALQSVEDCMRARDVT